MLGLKHLKQVRDEEHHVEFEAEAAQEHAGHKTHEVARTVRKTHETQEYVRHEAHKTQEHAGHETRTASEST